MPLQQLNLLFQSRRQMRKSLIFIFCLLYSIEGISQAQNISIYSYDVCHCLDSTGDAQTNFPDCFQYSLQKNYDHFIERLKQVYGGIPENADSLRDDMQWQISLDLIGSCDIFYKFLDSTMQSEQEKKNLFNKDSLRKILMLTDTVSFNSRDTNYFGTRTTIYYDLGEYDKALSNVDSFLVRNANSMMMLFYKAKILDLQGRWAEAVSYYDKVAQISQNRAVKLYSVMARRKENDRNKKLNR